MARLAKLTPEAKDTYLRLVAAGVPHETAATMVDLSRATLYRRLQGRTPADAEFKKSHDKAIGSFQARLIATVSKAAMTDPRMALELLERRFPKSWGRNHALDTRDVPDDPERPPEPPLSLDPELIEELVPRLLEAGRMLSGQPPEETDDVSEFADDGSESLSSDEGDDE
jgi:hypothetical protein